MKERDTVAVSALRTSLSALDNAEAVAAPDVSPAGEGPIAGGVVGVGAGDVPRRAFSETVMAALLDSEMAEWESAATQYTSLGRDEEAARLRRQMEVVRAVLKAP